MMNDINDDLCEAIGRVELLKPQEELSLALRIQNGDKEARDALVMANMRFAIKIAGTFSTKWRAEREDVIGSAIEGLIEAANRFDPGCGGTRFTTYARYWIEYKIKQYLNTMVPVIHVPVGQINAVRELHRDLNEESIKQNNPGLTEEQLAEQRGLRPEIVTAVKNAFSVISYDSDDATGVGKDITPNDVAKEQQDPPMELSDKMLDAIETLPDIYRDIIKRFFGIGCQPQTLQYIAMLRMLSRERIRQLKNEALEMLRLSLEPHLLEG